MTIDQICAAIPTLHFFEHYNRVGAGATLNGHAETLLAAGLIDQDRRVSPLGYVLLFALGAAAGRAGDFRDHADPAVRGETLAARTPEADNDYESEVHAAACWLEAEGQGDAIFLTHYTSGSTLWQTDDGMTTVRRKVDWLRAREAAAADKPAPLPPDPELRQAVRDRLFGKEGES